MSKLEFQTYYKRNLPHLQLPAATYFITCRLAGSLPEDVLSKLTKDSEHHIKLVKTIDDPTFRKKELEQSYLKQFLEWDKYLDDSKTSPIYLKNKDIAQIVDDSMNFRDGSILDISAY